VITDHVGLFSFLLLQAFNYKKYSSVWIALFVSGVVLNGTKGLIILIIVDIVFNIFIVVSCQIVGEASKFQTEGFAGFNRR